MNVQQALTVLSAAVSLISLSAALLRAHKRLLKIEKRGEEIAGIKKELVLICRSLTACLDGLEQLGANHTVTIAKNELSKHLNINAHK